MSNPFDSPWISDTPLKSERTRNSSHSFINLDLVRFRVPLRLAELFRNEHGPFAIVQPIDHAHGVKINLDYHSVVVHQLPTINGHIAAPEEFLNHIREHINDFVSHRIANFEPYDKVEAAKWHSSDPTGAIIHIDMNPGWQNLEDGSVMVSQHAPDHWIFSTVQTFDDLGHPVSGNREFGFHRLADGSFEFYTRGADRPTGNLDNLFSGTIFSAADNLWRSFQQGIEKFVNENGGKSNAGTTIESRHDWLDVRDFVADANYHATSELGFVSPPVLHDLSQNPVEIPFAPAVLNVEDPHSATGVPLDSSQGAGDVLHFPEQTIVGDPRRSDAVPLDPNHLPGHHITVPDEVIIGRLHPAGETEDSSEDFAREKLPELGAHALGHIAELPVVGLAGQVVAAVVGPGDTPPRDLAPLFEVRDKFDGNRIPGPDSYLTLDSAAKAALAYTQHTGNPAVVGDVFHSSDVYESHVDRSLGDSGVALFAPSQAPGHSDIVVPEKTFVVEAPKHVYIVYDKIDQTPVPGPESYRTVDDAINAALAYTNHTGARAVVEDKFGLSQYETRSDVWPAPGAVVYDAHHEPSNPPIEGHAPHAAHGAHAAGAVPLDPSQVPATLYVADTTIVTAAHHAGHAAHPGGSHPADANFTDAQGNAVHADSPPTGAGPLDPDQAPGDVVHLPEQTILVTGHHTGGVPHAAHGAHSTASHPTDAVPLDSGQAPGDVLHFPEQTIVGDPHQSDAVPLDPSHAPADTNHADSPAHATHAGDTLHVDAAHLDPSQMPTDPNQIDVHQNAPHLGDPAHHVDVNSVHHVDVNVMHH